MSEIQHTQCLLFVVRKRVVKSIKKLSKANLNKSVIDGYALIPESVINRHPDTEQFFIDKGVRVLRSGNKYPSLLSAVKCRKCEIISFSLKGDGKLGHRRCGDPFLHIFFQAQECDSKLLFKTLLPNGFDCHLVWGCLNVSHHLADDKHSIKILKQILKKNANISFRHRLGGTFLHYAVRKNEISLARLLLNYGVDIDGKGARETTALHIAAEKNYLPIVELLINNGANVDAVDDCNRTALHVASDKKHTSIVSFLIKAGANVNVTASDPRYDTVENSTPLHFALVNKDPEITKLLLENGADVDAIGYENFSNLQLAVGSKKPELVKLILNHRPSLALENNRKSFRLCFNVRPPIRKSASIFKDDDVNYTIIAEMMIEYGFSVDIQDINNGRLFHGAIRHNFLGIVEKLLALGTDFNSPLDGWCHDWDFDDYVTPENIRYILATPLHTAAAFAGKEMVSLFLKGGADANATNAWGDTPLIKAVLNDRVENVDLLLQSGANINQNGQSNYSALHCSAGDGISLEVVDLLLQKGANVNAITDYRATPLLCATSAGRLDKIKLLLKYGASIDCTEEKGHTGLHIASAASYFPRRNIQLPLVEFYLKNGVDVNVHTNPGNDTPLHLAVVREPYQTFKERDELVSTLLKFGARMNLKNDQGRTALQIVIETNYEILNTFLTYEFTDIKLVSDLVMNFYQMSIKPEFVLNYWLKNSVKIILKHAIKMTSAGFLVCVSNLKSFPGSTDFMNGFQSECDAEIANLKSEKVGNTMVSFFDILTKSTSKNKCYARNDDIVEVLKSNAYKSKFPIYASTIETQFNKCLERKTLLDEGVKVFTSLFPQFTRIPRDLQEKILEYLSNQDIMVAQFACFE